MEMVSIDFSQLLLRGQGWEFRRRPLAQAPRLHMSLLSRIALAPSVPRLRNLEDNLKPSAEIIGGDRGGSSLRDGGSARWFESFQLEAWSHLPTAEVSILLRKTQAWWGGLRCIRASEGFQEMRHSFSRRIRKNSPAREQGPPVAGRCNSDVSIPIQSLLPELL